jgi:hypothetical protein
MSPENFPLAQTLTGDRARVLTLNGVSFGVDERQGQIHDLSDMHPSTGSILSLLG